MYEASMERFIRTDNREFIGRAASLSKHQRGPRMKLVCIDVENTDSDCVGNEPVYHKGQRIGLTTSGGYGHAVNKSLAFAYVDPAFMTIGTALEVMVFSEMRNATIISESIWDPTNERLKA
jgi:dimethylglycine dehydrogenase